MRAALNEKCPTENTSVNINWWNDFTALLIENIGEELTLEDLAQFANMSKFSLIRLFQKKVGMSPMRWVWRVRAKLARELLIAASGNWSLTDIAFMCGFTSSAHFSRYMKTEFCVPPKKLQAKGKLTGVIVRDLYELTHEILPAVLQMAA